MTRDLARSLHRRVAIDPSTAGPHQKEGSRCSYTRLVVRNTGIGRICRIRALADTPDIPLLVLQLGRGQPSSVGGRPELQDSVQQRAAGRGHRPRLELILFFSGVPVVLGLAVATVMRRLVTGRLGAVARTVLFLPQVVPLVAAGIAWSWMLSTTGVVDQVLSNIGLGNWAQAWLGGFNTALPRGRGHWRLGPARLVHRAAICRHDQGRPGVVRVGPVGRAGPATRVPSDSLARAASRGCRLCDRDCDRCALSVRYCVYLNPGRPR